MSTQYRRPAIQPKTIGLYLLASVVLGVILGFSGAGIQFPIVLWVIVTIVLLARAGKRVKPKNGG